VEIGQQVRRRIVELTQRLAASGAPVKWVEETNLHITLNFLGDVTDEVLAQVCRRAEEAVVIIEPFQMALRRVGAFPSPVRPRVVWVGVEAGAGEMVRLQAALETALKPLGFVGEQRTFVPHLTIGRVRSSGAEAARIAGGIVAEEGFDAGMSEVFEAIVFASDLRPGGPRYTPLARLPLGGVE
jgi:2'-5' RNA ligase